MSFMRKKQERIERRIAHFFTEYIQSLFCFANIFWIILPATTADRCLAVTVYVSRLL